MMIEQLESRTFFSASTVVGDQTDVNIQATYVKAAFKSFKSTFLISDLSAIRADLVSSFQAKVLDAAEFRDSLNLTLSLGAGESTKLDAFAASGNALIKTVATDIALVVGDVNKLAAKPKSHSFRKLLKADLNQLESATLGKQTSFHSDLNHIAASNGATLDQIEALTTNDDQTQTAIDNTRGDVDTGTASVRGNIDAYFEALHQLQVDASALA